MKKNNEKAFKTIRPRIAGRVKLLVILMFLQAILANAKEGIVIRQQTNANTNFTYVLVDTDGNGFPDMNLYIPFPLTNPNAALLANSLTPGARVEVDDALIDPTKVSGMNPVPIHALLSINGVDILDIFPDFVIFESAEAARQRQQAQRSR